MSLIRRFAPPSPEGEGYGAGQRAERPSSGASRHLPQGEGYAAGQWSKRPSSGRSAATFPQGKAIRFFYYNTHILC